MKARTLFTRPIGMASSETPAEMQCREVGAAATITSGKAAATTETCPGTFGQRAKRQHAAAGMMPRRRLGCLAAPPPPLGVRNRAALALPGAPCGIGRGAVPRMSCGAAVPHPPAHGRARCAMSVIVCSAQPRMREARSSFRAPSHGAPLWWCEKQGRSPWRWRSRFSDGLLHSVLYPSGCPFR